MVAAIFIKYLLILQKNHNFVKSFRHEKFRIMKHIILFLTLLAAICCNAAGRAARMDAPAQGWEAGVDIGMSTPLHNGAFFPQIRPTLGFNAGRHISPVMALGVEGWWGINTSGWRGLSHSCTTFDNSYIGAAAALDLTNLIGGYPCEPRRFSTALSIGTGWGHLYRHGSPDHNYLAAKLGLLFRVRLSRVLGLKFQPAILWNLSDSHTEQSTAAFNVRNAIFHLQAGLTYSFGQTFDCVLHYDQTQINGLNGQVNDLRRQLNAATTQGAAAEAHAAQLHAELEACKAKPEVVREVAVNNRMNTVLDVFFHMGSAHITADQLPNVERIAAYLNSHPGSRVDIKGYASRDGNPESNRRLAEKRAVAVKNALIHKYKIAPSRIAARGAGIGDMFEVDSWNRVSVCTLEN